MSTVAATAPAATTSAASAAAAAAAVHKRPLDNEPTAQAKRKGTKPASKPGRKPLGTEAKNKRTAQNRAAQRAFRERKERKMKELEDKVTHLETVREQNEVETEFLRSQLMTLISELKKYRPEQSTDTQVLEYLAKREEEKKDNSQDRSGGSANTSEEGADVSHSSSESHIRDNIQKKMDFTFEFPWKDNAGRTQFPSPGSSSVSSNHKPSFSSNAPFNVTNNTPSTSSASLDMFYQDDALPKFTSSSSERGNNSGTIADAGFSITNDFDFGSHFDEQVSEFCTRMNQACGTRNSPVPQTLSKQSSSTTTPITTTTTTHHDTTTTPAPALAPEEPNAASSSPQAGLNLTNTWETPSFGNLGFGGDGDSHGDGDGHGNGHGHGDGDDSNKWLFTSDLGPSPGAAVANTPSNNADILPFIDTSIAFPTEQNDLVFRDTAANNSSTVFDEFLEEDPVVHQLTTEESVYDVFSNDYGAKKGKPSSPEENKGNYTTLPLSQESSNPLVSDDVVPSRDGKLLKCGEIWDRITSHPKYSDLDIDGLCMELRTKAKCSEKGVVVNADDVQKALAKHMS